MFVVVNSNFGGSCKEASRDDVYEAVFHDLYPKNTALGKHAQLSKHPNHIHTQACKVERAQLTRGAEAQIVTESRHEGMVDTASGIEFVGRSEDW